MSLESIEINKETSKEPILQVNDVVKHFVHNNAPLLALDKINLSVKEGDFVCLVGPSGCGKSTLLRIIAGLEKYDSGQVILRGRSITEAGPDRTMVFQEGALFPWLNVIENVEFGLKSAGIQKEKRKQIAMNYLEMVNLKDFANAYIHQLSGGMKQRVAIARALAMDPEILLMDEPFAALDAQTRDMLLVELQLIWQKTKKTILFVTHNIDESIILGNKVAVFKKRPSNIKKEITIDYPRPRLAEDRHLIEYKQEILAELKDEVRG